MTSTTDLTTRYLDAAARLMPQAQRDGFRRELAERIADTIEAKQDAGASFADAQYATLTELGHPSRLAADYADRPLQLIGPRYYLLWWQLLRLLVPIVAAAAAFGVALAGVLDEKGPWEVIADALSTGISGAVWVAFALTAVFAILERRDPNALAELDPTRTWTPNDLPEPSGAGKETRGERIVEAVWLSILGVVVLVVQQIAFVRTADDAPVPLFDAGTWAWLRWALFAVIAVEVTLTIVAIARGRRGWWQTMVRVLLNVAVLAVLVPPVASGTLINPAFLTTAGWADGVALVGPGGWTSTVAVVIIVAACLGDVIGAVRTAYRENPRLA